ncbi:MAG TPA: Smr/MutS family protein [Terriglobales bacterium]|nr:Smr/MutS family protein [Terriglobales bacterium]
MAAASDLALAAGIAVPDCEALIELLAGYLQTAMGRAELGQLRFHRSRDELARLQRRNQEAGLWLARGGFGFGSILDPASLLSRAQAPGAVLEGAELIQIAAFLDAAASLADALLGEEREQWPELAVLAEKIPDTSDLRRALRRALLPDGSLDDAASPELARLRRRRAAQRVAIESSLTAQLRRLGGEGVLQDELVTLRNDRFVLPVRAEQRRRAPGVLHGASSSGQTVFVEPLETVELNNENIRLRDLEQAEVARILAELTTQVGASAAALLEAVAAVGVLELEAAKARFARDFSAVPAAFDTELDLVEARHPVLAAALRRQGREVIPLRLQLGNQRVLVVSGPNTGGKTVVLKTVAIAAWMAQCGLPVCARRAQLPIFDALWADIGDVQSLEQNLSTFSSHLVHIRDILGAADAHSLILLDELGTATNAAEGAALAVEIAEALRLRRAWTLISTHHDLLKQWAAENSADVTNGSVAVDPATLAPNFQFRLGVPGTSAGLDMAARLGLPESIVAGARARLSAGEREAGRYLQKLQQQLSAAEDRVSDLARREDDVAARELALAAHDRAAMQKQIAALRAELDRRLALFAAAAEKQWKQGIESLQIEITSAQKRKLALAAARLRRETAESFQSGVLSALGTEAATPVRRREPRPGDRVRLRTVSQPARVLRELFDGGFEVEAGALRLQIAAGDIIEVLPPIAQTTKPVLDHHAPGALEINLIGLRAEEALDQLDKFLDRALLAEADEVRIVHGAGFGVLRKAVGEALRAHPLVARHFHPPQNLGGQGVTVAELK